MISWGGMPCKINFEEVLQCRGFEDGDLPDEFEPYEDLFPYGRLKHKRTGRLLMVFQDNRIALAPFNTVIVRPFVIQHEADSSYTLVGVVIKPQDGVMRVLVGMPKDHEVFPYFEIAVDGFESPHRSYKIKHSSNKYLEIDWKFNA